MYFHTPFIFLQYSKYVDTAEACLLLQYYIHNTHEFLPDHFSGSNEISIFIDVAFNHQVVVGVVGWQVVGDDSAGDAKGSGN